MSHSVGLDMDIPSDRPANDGRRRLPSFFDDQEPHSIQAVSPYSVHDRHFQLPKRDPEPVDRRQAALLSTPLSKDDARTIHPHSASRISDSGFSRHDSLFSFGVPSARNAAELKSLLGNSSSRLRPGATVLPHHAQTVDKAAQAAHLVSLERAKSRARVEVDIVLESDCCIAGGYLRGHVKLHVRKRQKKEAPVLLADGRVRVIGFESIAGTHDYHTFYQRASALSTITDAYPRVYDSPPDAEGFSRAMEGVHILPFAMYLSEDDMFGSAKGTANIHSGASLRYIAMISVKIKDSQTLKRSIAHFYRDCEVWPRLDLDVMLSTPSRPIHASSTKTLSAIGGGGQLRLTAMLHRSTWIAGQRCYVRIGLRNDTKRTMRTMALTLIRTTTLFKYRPVVNSIGSQSPEEKACQITTTHKVVAESHLEKSRPASKHHASTEGWWAGVRAGEDAFFAHHVLIPSDALSISRSRLIQVEYSIRVTASAGALVPDVHVALPLRIINFLSVDPTPSDPLLAWDGSYARLVPLDHSPNSLADTPIIQCDTDDTAQYILSELSTISISPLSDSPSMSPLSGYHSTPAQATPASAVVLDLLSGENPVSDTSPTPIDRQGHGSVAPDALQTSAGRDDAAAPPTSESGASMYSTDSNPSSPSPVTPVTFEQPCPGSSRQASGDLQVQNDADSEEEFANALDIARGGPLSGRTTIAVYPQRSQGRGSMKGTASVNEMSPTQFTWTSQRRPPMATFATSPSTIIGGNVERQEEPAMPVVAPISSVHDDTKREGSPTLTLHPPAASRDVSELGGLLVDASHSVSPRLRPPSRRLPQPPPQPEPLSNIPVSASAVGERQLSWLDSSCVLNAEPGSATDTAGPVPSSVHAGSNGPQVTTARRSPRTPSVSTVPRSNSSPFSSPRVPHDSMAGAIPVSTSGSTIRAHPADKVHRKGRSNSSVVRGRIAAYEERLRYSIDSGVGDPET